METFLGGGNEDELTFGRDGQVCVSGDRWRSEGLRGKMWGRQGLAVVVRRRQLHGRLVVRQRHARRELHLYTVMDVLFFDQPTGWCCGVQEVVRHR